MPLKSDKNNHHSLHLSGGKELSNQGKKIAVAREITALALAVSFAVTGIGFMLSGKPGEGATVLSLGFAPCLQYLEARRKGDKGGKSE